MCMRVCVQLVGIITNINKSISFMPVQHDRDYNLQLLQTQAIIITTYTLTQGISILDVQRDWRVLLL